MSALPKHSAADLRRTIADLQRQLDERSAELNEARAQQSATAEVLQVINSSPGDLTSVFEAMLDKAVTLCGAAFGVLWTYEGECVRAAAHRGVPPSLAAFLTRASHPIGSNNAHSRLHEGEPVVHVADAAEDKAYRSGDPVRRALVDLGGGRSLLAAPLRKDEALLGAFVIYRQEVRPFSEKQIALLQNFAAQAVIAMENARLLGELRARTGDLEESLKYQIATSDVLKVISRSTFDLQPVLDTVCRTAQQLCGAGLAGIAVRRRDVYRYVATSSVNPEWVAKLREIEFTPGRDSVAGRVALERRVVHVDDLAADPDYGHPGFVAIGGARTALGVPLLREGEPIGVIFLGHDRVRPFTAQQIELVRTFADQAVIAIENARLLTEQREALEQQSATAEVLEVINRSPGDLAPVFEAMLDKALRLCGAAFGILWTYHGDRIQTAATRGLSPKFAAYRTRNPPDDGPRTAPARILAGERVVHVADLMASDAYRAGDPHRRALVDLGGARSLLAVPLLKDERVAGSIMIYRQQPGAFSDKQIALLQNFATQAVIAMENARLLGELRQRTRDVQESLKYQTATSDVLKVISRSTFDLQPVLDTLVETAARLCQADLASINNRDDGVYRVAASYDYSPELTAYARSFPMTPGRETVTGRAALERQVVHVADLAADAEYAAPGWVTHGKVRTALGVPLLREGEPIGVIFLARRRVEPFTERQIELVRTFADQAVIAIENTRLITETREALEQQTATAEVLRIINSSPGELEPVFETMLTNAARLCEAEFGTLNLYDGDAFQNVALHNTPSGYAAYRRLPFRPHAKSGLARVARTKEIVHIADLRTEPPYLEGDAAVAAIVDVAGARTILIVPMLKENELVGTIAIYRKEVRLFTDRQIELVNNFARQAVIAIENTRLLKELRQRTADLARSVDELTATGDVLKIISRSSVDLETVLDTLAETVARLCRADQAYMFRRRDALHHLVAARGLSEEAKEFILAHPLAADRGTMTGRVELEGRALHIADVLQDPGYTYREAQKIQGHRTMLGIPLLREDTLIGVFCLTRTRVDPFTTNEIELATSFADQAVIAIENARLFDELRERQAELRVTFDNMGDGVAMFDAEARLAAWNRNFQEILDLPDDFLAGRPSFEEYFRYLAARGEYGSTDLEAELSRTIQDPSRKMRYERTRPDGRIIEVRRNTVPGGGFVVIYGDITERKRAEEAIRAARDAAETALGDLQTAQASLLHAQKMAALGQLTAGIAHEIKNPLNFVNNFAGLSIELLDELKAAAAPGIAALDEEKRAEIDETVAMLTGNLAKIGEHGRRADGIVKSMLAHSRGTSGERQAVDINAVVEEALNLAYHGARAHDPSFNITLERDLAASIAPIALVPQDITRVFLNLFGNGFYAANKRRQKAGESTFKPVLKVTTRERGEAVEIAVRDNGIGIATEHREKLFQPFFTTKPTGEGTGLGLSISYEIVTQQHGGTMAVDSRVGEFTEFTVRLPRAGAGARKNP